MRIAAGEESGGLGNAPQRNQAAVEVGRAKKFQTETLPPASPTYRKSI